MGTRLLAIGLALCLLGGCAVLEEIGEFVGAGVASGEQDGEGCGKGSQSSCSKQPIVGWSNITSISSDDMKADIVSCHVGNATKFTTRELCIARGGTPAS